MTNTDTAPRTITLADGLVIEVEIRGGVEMTYVLCSRCGTEDGRIRHYSYVFGGVCFKCNGAGGKWVPVAKAIANGKARARAAARREAERLAKIAEAEQGRDAFRVDHPAIAFLADDLTAVTVWNNGRASIDGKPVNGILLELSGKLRRFGSLSAGQIALAEKIVAEDAERAAKRAAEQAAANPAPAARVTVTGVVTGLREYDGDFGTTYKMHVKADDGYRVFVTIPRDIDPAIGDRVRFTATLAPADDDPTFAKGSRPVKGAIL